jgi:hypothetical protein
MLATFAFDVCHDVYRAAREVIDAKIPTMNMESSGKYTWHPDRMPRLAEYVADFARAGERALGNSGQAICAASARTGGKRRGDPLRDRALQRDSLRAVGGQGGTSGRAGAAVPWEFRASRMAMFRVFYLGGADYQAARRHLGISELTWGDWAEEIRTRVGQELASTGVFPPSKYFRSSSRPENAA